MATLITGLGYIGAALALRLMEAGEHVVGIENFFSTPRSSLSPLADAGRLSLIEGSLSDEAVLHEAFSVNRIESVFHLAAQASARPDAASLAYTQETNFTGPRLLLDACRDFGVARVVLASSMRLYRTPLPAVVSEDAPIDPTDLVHLSQLYGEVLVEEHRRRAEPSGPCFAAVAARMGIVHGVSPVMKTDPRFLAAPQLFGLRAARGEPLTVLSDVRLAFVHIDDAVGALLECREHATELRIANVASEVLSILSVAETVRRAGAERGLSVDIQGPRSRDPSGDDLPAPSVRLSLTSYGFQPTLRIEDSVGDVLDYYLAQGAPACESS